MKTANTIKKVFLISSILFVQNTFAISKEMNLLVQLETKANAVATRSSAPVALENYEIPLNEVVFDFNDRLKSMTSGYASFDYEIIGHREGDLVKLGIMTPNMTSSLLKTSQMGGDKSTDDEYINLNGNFFF